MKKILTLALALVMLVSVFAVLPASAADEADEGWTVLLNSGIVLNYYEGGEKVDSVSVAAKEMAKSQTVGNKTISVVEYLEGLLAGEYSENTKKLATALINYGAAAYDYFDAQGKCEDLPEVNGEPVTDTTALKDAEAPEKDVDDADGIYLGATLVLEGTMKLRFYFKGETRTGTVDGTDNVSAIKKGDGNCYFDVAVMPYAIGDPITVAVDNTTVTYAPINYLQAKADDPVLSSMVASIYAYGVAAKTYNETDGCEHNGDFEFEIIKPATLFTEGEKKNYCKICGNYVNNSSVEKTEVQSEHFPRNKNGTYTDSHTFADILNGDHFYPTNDDPDGKALYIEYSMLFSEEFVNAQIGQGYMLLGRFDSDASTYDNKYDIAYALSIGPNDGWTDHGTPGHFDVLGKDGDPVDGDFTYSKPDASTFPSIGGYGWHRIGIVVKQINSTHLNATLYIDGVKLSSHNIKPRTSANLLYTVENGEYKDIDLNRVVRAFYFGETGVEAEVDFKYADLYVTAGDDFVLPVVKLDTPTAVDGIDGTTYFEYKSASDCDLGNHTWATEATVDVAPTCTTDGEKSIKCTVCKAKDPDSVETIPGGHKWATEATVDTAATCTTDGQKSIKCTVCTEIKPGSVEVIKSAGQHVWANETIVAPTLFTEGRKTGTCSACNEALSEVLPKAEPTVITFTPDTKGSTLDAHSFGEILDGDHFYPTTEDPDGKALYIEYSMLFSEEFVNAQIGQGYMLLGRFDSGASKQDSNYDIAYALSIGTNDGWTDHGTPGHFDVLSKDGAPVYGPDMSDKTNLSTYPSIGGYGWHRIGIVVKQINSTQLNATLYIDGVKVSSHNINPRNSANLLYSVKNGEYKDIDHNRVVRAYYFGESKSDATGYFAIADLYVTAGDGFVMPVEKLDTPTEGTYSPADGVTLDADQHFTYVD